LEEFFVDKGNFASIEPHLMSGNDFEFFDARRV
jgi:hypothetical protein